MTPFKDELHFPHNVIPTKVGISEKTIRYTME